MERTNVPFVKDECYFEKCRLCTFPSGNTCTDIYSEKEPRRLTEQIKICTGIEVAKDDGLPQRLCSRCYIMLRLFYPFVLEAQQAQFTLTYWEYISQNLPLPEGVEYPEGYKGHKDECNHRCKKIDDNFRIDKNDGKSTLLSKPVAAGREIITKVELSPECESKSEMENEVEATILSSKKRDSSDSKRSKPKLIAGGVTKRTVRKKTHKKWRPGKLILTKYRNTTLLKESNVSNILSSAGDVSVEKTCKLFGGKIESEHNNTPVYQPSSSSSTQLQDILKLQITENNLEGNSSVVEPNDSFLKGKDISLQEEKHSETHSGNTTQCGQIISSKHSVNGPSSLSDTDVPQERNSYVNSSENHGTGDTSSTSVKCVSKIKEVNNVEDKESHEHLNVICTSTDENLQKSAHNSTSDMLPFRSPANGFETSEEQDQASYKHEIFTSVDKRDLCSVSGVTEGNARNDQIESTSESFSLSGANGKEDIKSIVEKSLNIDSKCDIVTHDADKQDVCYMDASCHLSIDHPVISEIACVDKASTVIDVEPSSRSSHEDLMEHRPRKEKIGCKSNISSQKSEVVSRMEISCRHGDKDVIESSMNEDKPVSTEKINGKKISESIVIDLQEDSFSPEDVLVKHIIFKPVINDSKSHLQESTALSGVNSDSDVKFSSNSETQIDKVTKKNSFKSFPEEDGASVKPNKMCNTSNSLPDNSSGVHQSLLVNISQEENGGVKNTVISTKLCKTLSVNISQKENGEVENTVISAKLISEDTSGSSTTQTNSEAKTDIPCDEDHCHMSRGSVVEHDVKDQLAAEHDVKGSSSRTKSCPKVVASSPPGTRRLRQRKIPERFRSDSFLKTRLAPVTADETQSRMKNKLDKQNDSRLTISVKKGKVVKSSGVQRRKKVKLFNKDKCDLVLDTFCMENKLQVEMKSTVELESKLSLKTPIPDKENVVCIKDRDDKASKDQHIIKPVVIDLTNFIEDEVHSNTGDLISKIEKNVNCTPQSVKLPTDKEVKILSNGDISLVQPGTSPDSLVAEVNESVIASVGNKDTTHSGVKCRVKYNKAENRSEDIKETGNKNSYQKLLLEDKCEEKDNKAESRSTDIRADENISDQILHPEDKHQEKDDKVESRSTYIRANENYIPDQKLHPEDKHQEKDDKAESRSTDIRANENISDQKLHPEDKHQEKDVKVGSRSADIRANENDLPNQKLHPGDKHQEKDDKVESRSTDIRANENDLPEQKLQPEDKHQEKDDKVESSRSADIRANENDVTGQKLQPEDKHQEKDDRVESRSTDTKEGENENSCQKLALSPTMYKTACMPPATIFISPSSLKGKNKPKGKKKSVSFDFPEESLKSNDNESVSIITSDVKHPASRRNILKNSDCEASGLKLSPDKPNKSNILEETNRSYDMQKALNNNSLILPLDGCKLSRASRICRLIMSPRKSLTNSSVSGGTLQDESNTTCDETLSKEQHSSLARKLDVSPSVTESSSPSSAKHDGTYKRVDSTSPQTEGRLSRATRILQLVTSPVQEPQNKISAGCTEDGGQDKSTNKEKCLENTEELLAKNGTSESSKCTDVANSDNLLALNEVDAASLSGANSSSSSTLPKVNEVSKQESPIQSIISTGKNKRSKRKSVRFNIPEVMSDSSEETSGNSLSVCESDESSDVQILEGEAEVQNDCKSVPNSDPTSDSELNGTHPEEESNSTHEITKLPTKVSEVSYSRASRICSLVMSPLTRRNIETSFMKREAESPKNMDASSVRRERDNSPLQKLSPITGSSQSTRASRIFNLICPNKDDSKTGHINASPKLDSGISAVQLALKIPPPSDDVSNEITKSIDDQNRLSVLTCKIMDSEMMRTPPVARRSLKRKLLDESNLTSDKEAKIFVRSPHPDVMSISPSEVDDVNEDSRIHPTREINNLADGQLLLGKEHTLTCPVTSEVCDKSSRETVDSDSIIRNSECEERVSGNESADVHMNGHLNEDQLSSENCSATCTQQEDSKVRVNLAHVKSSDSLPWILKCELCSTSFHSKQRLLLHIKRFHGKDTKSSNKTVK